MDHHRRTWRSMHPSWLYVLSHSAIVVEKVCEERVFEAFGVCWSCLYATTHNLETCNLTTTHDVVIFSVRAALKDVLLPLAVVRASLIGTAAHSKGHTQQYTSCNMARLLSGHEIVSCSGFLTVKQSWRRWICARWRVFLVSAGCIHSSAETGSCQCSQSTINHKK